MSLAAASLCLRAEIDASFAETFSSIAATFAARFCSCSSGTLRRDALAAALAAVTVYHLGAPEDPREISRD